MSIVTDLSFLTQLRHKQEILRKDYDKYFSDFEFEPADLSDTEVHDFLSMSRWHANSHITEEEWLQAFRKISRKLDVKENMPPLSDAFIVFLRCVRNI